MGHFRVTVEIGGASGARFEPVDALVDTGATYTWMPRSLLVRLGLSPQEQRDFILADGRRVPYGMAWAPVRLDGRTQPTLLVFGDDDTDPLLGVFTLEGFGLGVDAVNQRLIPTPAYLL